jgi:hypothetical protein
VDLFGTCRLALAVWSNIMNWLGLQSVQPSDLCSSFESFGFSFNVGKKRRKRLYLIWHVVIWSLWKARNACIFEEKVMPYKTWLKQLNMCLCGGFLLKVSHLLVPNMSG